MNEQNADIRLVDDRLGELSDRVDDFVKDIEGKKIKRDKRAVFEGLVPDAPLADAIIRHERKLLRLRRLVLYFPVLMLLLLITWFPMELYTDTRHSAIVKEAGFNPTYPYTYYEQYAAADWYRAVSDADVDPYDFRGNSTNEHISNRHLQLITERMGYGEIADYMEGYEPYTPEHDVSTFIANMRERGDAAAEVVDKRMQGGRIAAYVFTTLGVLAIALFTFDCIFSIKLMLWRRRGMRICPCYVISQALIPKNLFCSVVYDKGDGQLGFVEIYVSDKFSMPVKERFRLCGGAAALLVRTDRPRARGTTLLALSSVTERMEKTERLAKEKQQRAAERAEKAAEKAREKAKRSEKYKDR